MPKEAFMKIANALSGSGGSPRNEVVGGAYLAIATSFHRVALGAETEPAHPSNSHDKSEEPSR
jgi:hypothetical protein